MANPFDDPEFRRQLEQLGVVHKPGLAKSTLNDLAPLLAADGFDLDNLEADDLDSFNDALERATQRHNFELFTPVGRARSGALAVLRDFTLALADGDAAEGAAVLAAVEPDPEGEEPAISHVIGVALGLLDAWRDDPTHSDALARARVPRWNRNARAAATDILALARKGRAFDSVSALHRHGGGLGVFEGGALAVAAAVMALAAATGTDVGEVAAQELADEDSPSAGAVSTREARRSGGEVRPAFSAQPGAAFQRGPAGSGPGRAKRGSTSGHPARRGMAQADRALLREFRGWLGAQPAIAAPTVGDEADMLQSLLAAAGEAGLSLRDPDDLGEFVDNLLEIDDEEAAEAVTNALDTLHDLVHFHLETADDPEVWEVVHEVIEDAVLEFTGERDPLADALAAADEVPEEVRRAALARTVVARAVPRLLEWLGSGRRAAPSGGLRRDDIHEVAAMLGIHAIGVSKRSSQPRGGMTLFDSTADAPLPEPDAIEAMAMQDVPVLAAWWRALEAAEIIEVKPGRARPGAAAGEWLSAGTPALKALDTLVAFYVAEILTDELIFDRVPAAFTQPLVAGTLQRLLNALSPDDDGDDERLPGDDTAATGDDTADLLAQLQAPRALLTLSRLAQVGLIEGDLATEPVVPLALRGAVARGVILTLARMVELEPTDPDADW